jgi:hypothetical protein
MDNSNETVPIITQTMWIGYREELTATREARDFHRLHEAFLLMRGFSVEKIGRIFHERRKTVIRNIHAGLQRRKEPKPGKKAGVDYEYFLRKSPSAFFGLTAAERRKKDWNGLMLKKAIKYERGVDVELSHCQRIAKRFRER